MVSCSYDHTSLLSLIVYFVYFSVSYSDFEACSAWKLLEISSRYPTVVLVLLDLMYFGNMACIGHLANESLYVSVM